MASIIPSPGSPPPSPTVTAAYVMTGADPVIDAGTILYATNISWPNDHYNPSYGTPTVWVEQVTGTAVNNGEIWSVVSDDNATGVFVYQFAGLFENNGKIVARVTEIILNQFVFAYGVVATGGLNNTGEIFAFSPFSAMGVHSAGGFQTSYTNSGLIAAQGGQAAYGIYLHNGGLVNNAAGGSILAEADAATAIYINRGGFPAYGPTPEVTNAGLIEAVSLDSSTPSVGIQAEILSVESMRIVNSGTIRADVAIYNPSYHSETSSTQKSVAVITNEATGIIEGDIILELGDDIVTNAGLIEGDLLMGEGDDTVDSSEGAIQGVVHLGFGADVFYGGESDDAVLGDRDDDVLDGGAGDDLLLGGRGDDVIAGGTGNDGLYGEYGDDVISTQGGDAAAGGAGDDRIELGDLTFAWVNGGAGTDTLVMPTGAAIFDLQAMRTSGRLTSIESVELTGSQGLVVRAADVIQMTQGGVPAIVHATETDTVYLVGEWAQGPGQFYDGVAYSTYASGATVLLVDAAATVNVSASPPGGAVGLSPVAAGDTAPIPGSAEGVELTGAVTTISGYYMAYPLTIESGEVWQSLQGGSPVGTSVWFVGLPLTNYGEINSWSEGSVDAYGVGGGFLGSFDNFGQVGAYVSGSGDAIGFLGGGYGRLNNQGSIEAQTLDGIAVGVETYDIGDYDVPAVLNDGEIFAYSETDFAVGMFSANDGANLVNNGQITAYGGLDAVGVHLGNAGGNFQNNGSVIAVTSLEGNASIGVYYFINGYQDFTNNGSIQADIAILVEPHYSSAKFEMTNFGQVTGWIILGETNDVIDNKGSINGTILLGAGADVYKGGGAQSGGVFGEDGDDRMTGGSGVDEFFGDNGADVLEGGGGADVLSGGAGVDQLRGGSGDDRLHGGLGADALEGGSGADTFVYLDVAESPGSGRDRIRDFQSGVDKIDLTILGRTSISWTQHTDTDGSPYFVVTIQTGHGPMTIRVDTPALTMADFLVTPPIMGTSGNDNLEGTVDPDEMRGEAGHDVIDGFMGADILKGGAGNDRLHGGEGLDELDGEAGNDTADYSDQTGAVVVVLKGAANTTVTVGGVAEDIIRNIENVIGGSGDDILTGDALANQLRGGAGNDRLDGRGGADTMYGGAGDDIYYFDDPGDAAGEATGEGIDTVHSAVSLTLAGNLEHLFLTGSAAIDGTGNGGANNLYGNAADNVLTGGGGHDRLKGGDGADTMIGGTGNDVYVVDSEEDVVIENAGEGIDTVNTSVSLTLGDDVENLALLVTALDGVGNDLNNRLTGNALPNILEGLGGNDVLDGGAGGDTLRGGAGTDKLYGGDGADTIDGGSGADRLSGGAGSDTFVYQSLADSTLAASDRIVDFNALTDWIDLSAIDADATQAGDQAFVLASAFSGVAGEAVLTYYASSNTTTLTLDVDGDRAADFRVRIAGEVTGDSGFIL